MTLKNKLNINDSSELAKREEEITKKRAVELFTTGKLNEIEVGTFKGLSLIHEYLFSDIYEFAGKMRTENIAKGDFRFASALYLDDVLEHVSNMPQKTADEIIEKYVEMNVAHPFREGNGRSMRIWLDQMLKKELGMVIDWSLIDKNDYLLAMERSPVSDKLIKLILKDALTDKINDREVFMKGIDNSYKYEGFESFRADDLP